MPARKKPTVTKTKVSAAAKVGAVPPYGIAIREAMARGNVAEMKKTAASARKYLKDLQTAVAALEKALGK
jgi:hypothetical protein